MELNLSLLGETMTCRLRWSMGIAAAAGMLVVPVTSVRAVNYTLDASNSPITVVFSTGGGRLTVTNKADGFAWKHPESGGGDGFTVGTVTQVNNLVLSASGIMSTGTALTVTLELFPTNGDLRVTLSGSNSTLRSWGMMWPYAFYPVGQSNSGFAVLPVDTGYVVPCTLTNWDANSNLNYYAWRRNEWLGGTDRDNEHGWIGIAETHADYVLYTRTATFEGCSVIGGVTRWLASGDNPARDPNLLSYDRTLRYRFFTSGGYVKLAKHFREYAKAQGWVKTLAQKNEEDPEHKVDKLVGAPVLYLWGDGRSTSLLDALTHAGLTNALIQLDINHTDHNQKWPNAVYADTNTWMKEVRNRGFLPGIFDNYYYRRTNGVPVSPYDGWYYLWPDTNVCRQWAYHNSATNPVSNDNGYNISMQKQADFARNTRVPAHLTLFDMDACFFDQIGNDVLYEDYGEAYGHSGGRRADLSNRVDMLSAGYTNASRRLIVGTEQGRSWTVPVSHWSEGRFWLGETGIQASNLVYEDSGTWDDNSYPNCKADVVDPTKLVTNKLCAILTDGHQAPLWDLVFHDCIVAPVHWSRSHNKFMYVWDHADLWALLRGQAPLLNMVESGVQGVATRVPNYLTNAFGEVWSTRWTVMSNRYVQTFTSVCPWQAKVMYMEMTDHQWLKPDRSVQLTEFSDNGGRSGHGIVVNLGLYDGAYGVTNESWTGTVRNAALTVPVKGYQTYSWTTAPPRLELMSSASNVLQVSFPGEPGSSYDLQTTTNLAPVNWLKLTTMKSSLLGTNVTHRYPDSASSNLQQRFYRVMTPGSE